MRACITAATMFLTLTRQTIFGYFMHMRGKNSMWIYSEKSRQLSGRRRSAEHSRATAVIPIHSRRRILSSERGSVYALPMFRAEWGMLSTVQQFSAMLSVASTKNRWVHQYYT